MGRVLVAVLLAALVLAPPARAERYPLGSDLVAAAAHTQEHTRDWAAFANAAPGSAIVVPRQGEVTMAQFKGTVLKPPNDAAYNGHYPEFVFHVVVLRPQPGGTKRLIVASNDLPFPFGGDDQQVTTIDLQSRDSRVCAQAGDIVALATSGGFGNHTPEFGGFPDDFFNVGYQVKMFGDGSAGYGLFEQPAGDDTFQVGDDVPTTEVAGQELLMRVTIGTGADARWTCRTPEEQSARLPNPGQPAPGTWSIVSGGGKVRKGQVRVAVRCDGGPCSGKLKLRRSGVLYGSADVTLSAGEQTYVTLALARKPAKRRFVVSASLRGVKRNFTLRSPARRR